MTLKRLNIINIILVFLMFPASALLVKDYVVYKRAGADVPVVKVKVAAPVVHDIQEYAPIVETPVFVSAGRTFTVIAGQVNHTAAATPVVSSGGLKLVGTFVGRANSRLSSFAIFENKEEGRQEVFKKGESVFGGGLLESIEEESVRLMAGSRSIILSMETQAPDTSVPVSGLRGGNAGRGKAVRSNSKGQFKYSKKTGTNQWTISQDAVLNALDDMGAVLSAARLTPVMKDNAVEGFLVTEIMRGGIMDAIGLKNGDILKRVNGYEITSPERAMQVLSAIKGEASFELDIVRNGRNMTLRYQVV